MEGVAAEAASLAGHLGLGKLIYLYDANDVTLDGPASLIFSEDVGARYAACGWQVITVEDGDHDVDGLDRAIAEAKADTTRPSLIIVKTTIGFGSPKKAGTAASHGSPLGSDEVAATKKALGWDPAAQFLVPDPVRAHFAEAAARGQKTHAAWATKFAAWRAAFPDLAAQWDLAWKGELPAGWDQELPSWKLGEKVATRSASGKVMTAIAKAVPWFFGGDADLGGSTKTIIPGGDWDGRTGQGKNLRFGVREHAMGSICNGLVYHGGVRPFAATFFVFSDYMRPAVRLAALNGQPVPGGGSLTLRAVAVAAAVVGDLGVGAGFTARDVAAERRGAAAHDRRHHPELAEAHMPRIGPAPGGPVAIEDVGDL
jgi:transketolase